MTDWWSNDPIASAPTPPAAPAPSANWWEQDATVMPAPKAAPPVDPIKAQVRKEMGARHAAGEPRRDPFQRRLLQGLTMGLADEIMAVPMTPVQMYKRSTLDPFKAYEYAKAQENVEMEDARDRTGVAGTIAEMAGGVTSGVGLFKAGATLAPAIASKLGNGLLGTAAGAAADGAAYGALTGAAEGEGWGRIGEGALGASIGGALGGALPLGAAAVGTLAAPVVSNISARVNPTAYAERQIARTAQESGRSVDDIVGRLQAAAGDNQPEFRLLDALGNAGIKKGVAIAKNPGEGRQLMTDFVTDRQSGQGRRIGEAVTEAFDTPQTARQQSSDLYTWARDASEPFYQRALAEAPVTSERLQEFFKDPITKMGVKRGMEIQRLEALAEGKAFNPHDIVESIDDAGEIVLKKVPNMRTINVVKKGFDDILEQYRDSTTGKLRLDEKGRAIDQVRKAFLNEADALNPEFAQARAMYAGPMQIKDALVLGKQAGSGRARASDNIAQFQGMNEPAKQGFRVGYTDPVLARVERAAEGSNKARPFTSGSSKEEMAAFARPGEAERLGRRLGRENDMYQAYSKVTGGSPTAEILSENAATGVDMGVVGKLLSGEFFGAAKHALNRAGAGLNGNTEAVRENMARLLLRGNPDEVRTLLNQLAAQSLRRSDRGALLTRGIVGGATPLIERLAAPKR